MTSDDKRLKNARAEASFIFELSEADVAKFFYRESMRRNLSRVVRNLDLLVQSGGVDRDLGAKALQRLGFGIDE
jgi:hypothetical protein